jgi:hypothetical protein
MNGKCLSLDGREFRFHSALSRAVAEYSVRRRNAYLIVDRLLEAGLIEPGDSIEKVQAAWAAFNASCPGTNAAN